MRKSSREKTIYNISESENYNTGLDKSKTTDINVLLNRVKIIKKTEFKKKLIFLSLLLLVISFVSILTFIF